MTADAAVLQARGTTGDIVYDGGTVILKRRSFVGEARDTQTYAVANITMLEYRAASAFESGFLRIGTVGSTPGILLSHDRNAITFQQHEQDAFATIYSALHCALYGSGPDPEILHHKSPDWVVWMQATIAIIVIGALVKSWW